MYQNQQNSKIRPLNLLRGIKTTTKGQIPFLNKHFKDFLLCLKTITTYSTLKLTKKHKTKTKQIIFLYQKNQKLQKNFFGNLFLQIHQFMIS